jgi:hypothetical protein
MPENRTRFDPLGWLIATCTGLLFGAIALAIAVHLIRAVWPWLIGILATTAAVGLLTRFAWAWHRRQEW